ncbi:MAG: sulfatase-like hydrolase/transferase [Mariniblastus sp.]
MGLSPAKQKQVAFRREIYAAQIERMDLNIGRIVAKLESLNKLDNTLILFLSDNACCAEGGMFGYQFEKNKKENFRDCRNNSGRLSSTGEAWSNVSNNPFRLHKRWVHEGGIATPLIAHWPKVITKTRRVSPASWSRDRQHVDLRRSHKDILCRSQESGCVKLFNGMTRNLTTCLEY